VLHLPLFAGATVEEEVLVAVLGIPIGNPLILYQAPTSASPLSELPPMERASPFQ
jgi:hypothetical protein